MAKIRILVATDGVVPTGLARVAQSIFSRLPCERYDIHHLAVNYRGDPHDLPWKVYPACAGGDVYGLRRIGGLIEKLKPQIVFVCNDLWIQAEYLTVLRKYADTSQIVTYSPVESSPVDPDWLKDLDIVSRFVVYTEFGRQEVQRVVPPALGDRFSVIPHGVDHKTFFPMAADSDDLSETVTAKRRLGLLPDGEIEDSFVVLNANRNQSRKRIDLTIRAFSQFAQDKPSNVKLYLHMGMQDVGWDVVKLARRFGIEDRLIMSSSGGVLPDISDDDMNLIYNACDVGVNTSSCEGWGLVSFEHAATGKPQIIPDLPSLRQLWKEGALMASVNRSLIMEQTLLDQYLADDHAVSSLLEQLYRDRSLCAHWGDAAYANAAKYPWDAIARQWDELFNGLSGGSA